MSNLVTLNIDSEIKEIDKNIFENIERSTDADRGFLSQNIKINIPEREDFSKFLPFLLKYSRAGKN